MKSKGCFVFLAVLIVAGLAFTGVSFFGGKFLDRYQRPWAYSTSEPLLVGRWRGQFRDPDGIQKTLTVQIDLPETDDERWAKAGRRKRRSRTNKRAFDGTATVTSRKGQEDYEIHGAIDRDNDHQFSLNFGTVDGQYPIGPNFYVNISEKEANRWQDSQMNLRLRFAWHRRDGSSFSNSADPRYDRTADVVLTRMN
ncbi:MAG: hypothetical protein EAZ91_02960 [Cytophagales bacterium]|nr:MAG: hypothetical protein EAZ91_02960 [Cytophagales bacterium]